MAAGLKQHGGVYLGLSGLAPDRGVAGSRSRVKVKRLVKMPLTRVSVSLLRVVETIELAP